MISPQTPSGASWGGPQGQRTLNGCDPVRTSIRKSSLQPQLRRFMTRLWRPGCCFSSDRVKRFSQAKFSRRCRSRIRDSSSRYVTSRTPMTAVLDAPVAPDRAGELLHAHRQAADVVADLDRLLPVPDAAATSPPRSTSAPSTARTPAGPRAPAVGGTSASPHAHAPSPSSHAPGRRPGRPRAARRCAR